MPIIIETEKRGSLVNVSLIALLIVVMAVATYFVFFAEAPYIDNFSSNEFKKAAQIKEIKFDTLGIVNNPVYRLLKTQVALPSEGDFGRDNPFIAIQSFATTSTTTTSSTTSTTTSTTTIKKP